MNIVYWTTKDKRKINIDEMSVDHLRNIVKMIVKQSQDLGVCCDFGHTYSHVHCCCFALFCHVRDSANQEYGPD